MTTGNQTTRRQSRPWGTRLVPDKPISLDGVSIRPDGSFVVDWEKLGLVRPLTDKELICLRVYHEHKHEHGMFPKSELKHKVIRDGAAKYGVQITHKEIDETLLAHLFPHNVDLSFTFGVRRLLADSRGQLNSDESRECVRYLSELMSYVHGNGKRVIPSTADVDRAVKAGIVVPGVVALMPTSTALLHSLRPGTWREIVERNLDATFEELLANHVLILEMSDLVADYQRAFAHRFPHYQEGDRALLTYEDLDAYREHGGIGSSRYTAVLNRESKKQKTTLTLNDVRSMADRPVDEHTRARKRRPIRVSSWSKYSSASAYVELWKHIGFDQMAPSVELLKEMVKKQSDLIREGHYEYVPERQSRGSSNAPKMIPAITQEAADKAGVPTTLLPSHAQICKVHDNMAGLLGYIQQMRDLDPGLDEERHRISRMATEFIKKITDADGKVPSGAVIQLRLSRIPATIASEVRTRLCLPEPEDDAKDVPHGGAVPPVPLRYRY